MTETEITIYGRQISLNEIRSKLLGEHERLGIARISQHSSDSLLSDGELSEALNARHIAFDSNASTAERSSCFKHAYSKDTLKCGMIMVPLLVEVILWFWSLAYTILPLIIHSKS